MPRDYDSVYKAFYERLFQRWQVPVETQVEVSRRAKAIDVVVVCEEQHLHRLQETCFWFFRRINDLELKSPGDALDLADYMTIVSRAYGLLAKQEDKALQLPTNATLTIVCSVRPTRLIDDLQTELGFEPTAEPGIYISEQRIEERIIVSTELEVIEKNYPLLILAKGEKLLEFFLEVVRKELTEYVDILFQVGIHPDTLTEGVIRMIETHPEFTEGLERALTRWLEFSPQSMERIAPIRRFLEEQRQALEEQRRELEEQRRALEEQRQALEEQRRNDKREDLRLLLENKFGQLSEEFVSQLEAVSDVDELTGLYKRALDAQTLAEVGLQKHG